MARVSGVTGSVSTGSTVNGIKSWTLDQVFDPIETTGFDSAGNRTYVPVLSGWSGSFEGYKNGAPLAIGTVISLSLLETSTSGQLYTGSAIVKGLSAKTSVDGVATYAYQFQGTSTLTIATA